MQTSFTQLAGVRFPIMQAAIGGTAGRPAAGARPGENEPVGTHSDGSAIQRYSAPHPVTGMSGDLDAFALYAGQSVGRVSDILSATSIVEQTMREARAVLRRAGMIR